MSDSLATWLNAETVKRGWSLRQVAQKAGVSHTTIYKIANNERTPRAESCRALADVFGVSTEFILRLAGLLPAVMPRVSDRRVIYQVDTAVTMERMLELWDTLTPDNQAFVLELMAKLTRAEPRIIGATDESG